MSVNLIKQPRRKTYDIRVFLSKHKKYKYINTYCTTEREAKKILKKYQTIDIEYNLGLRESQLPTEPVPSLGEGVEKYLVILPKLTNCALRIAIGLLITYKQRSEKLVLSLVRLV